MRYGLLLIALCLASSAVAQQPSETKPAQDAAAPAATPKPYAARKAACRESGGQKGLRGTDLADHVQLCVEEAKLDCLKQAIVQKVPKPERRAFIQTCAEKL